MTAIQIRPGIQVDDVALAAFAGRHHVTRLALYGSSPEVELRTYGDLSRFFRDEVASSARVLYAA